MSINAPNIYAKQFASTLVMLLQQKDSRLRSAATMGGYMGTSAQVVDQVGSVEMQPVVGRFQPMGRVDATLDSRWVNPSDFDLPQLIDAFDKLRLLVDPESTYVQNALAAAKRKQDKLLIAAFFGTAKTGVDGSTSTSFLSANQVAVDEGAASNTGMSVAKLKKARKILRAAEVDFETDQIYCAITANEEEDLLNEIQVISLDFNDRAVLVDGKLQRLLGINFIHTELLDTDGSGYQRCPVWAKSGMHLGVWNEPQVSVSQRNDLQGEPWQCYLKMTMGATRLEEKKVVEIKCA